jgi:outer membrane protein assembly factor BamB
VIAGPTEVLPDQFGGILTPPAAADGVVYVAVLNSPSTYDPSTPLAIGRSLGAMPGEVVALDAATGTIRWDVPVPGDPTGGATVVNDVVLTATLQCEVLALARATATSCGRGTPPAASMRGGQLPAISSCGRSACRARPC